MQFDACILGDEPPLYRGSARVAACRSGGRLTTQGVGVVQAPVRALSVHRAELDFGHVELSVGVDRSDGLGIGPVAVGCADPDGPTSSALSTCGYGPRALPGGIVRVIGISGIAAQF